LIASIAAPCSRSETEGPLPPVGHADGADTLDLAFHHAGQLFGYGSVPFIAGTENDHAYTQVKTGGGFSSSDDSLTNLFGNDDSFFAMARIGSENVLLAVARLTPDEVAAGGLGGLRSFTRLYAEPNDDGYRDLAGVADAAHAYVWSYRSYDPKPGDVATLTKLALADNAVTWSIEIADGPHSTYDDLVAQDDDQVFWAGTEGIYALDKEGGEPELVVERPSPHHIHRDARFLYYALPHSIEAIAWPPAAP